MSNAKLVITRTSQWTNKMRDIKIFVNGNEVGKVGNGKTIEIPVTAGMNLVYAKVDSYSSKPLHLNITPDQTIQLELGSPLKGAKVFLATWYALFRQKDWLYLRQK